MAEMQTKSVESSDELSVTEFVELHKPQLLSSGVPERYWSTLYEKLKSEEYDAGDYFQIILEDITADDDPDADVIDHRWKVVVYNEEGIQHHDSKHIYLIDHAWTFQVQKARKNLEEIPSLLKRMVLLMEVDNCETEEEKIEKVLDEMWRFNQTYRFGNFEKGTDESMPVWYIMDEFGSRVQHSDEPSCRMVPFVYAPTQMAFTLMWPTKDLEHGDEVTRNYVELKYDSEIRKAKLLPWVHTDMTYIDYHQREPDTDYFTQLDKLPNLSVDFPPLPRDRTLKVFIDYHEIFRNSLTDPRFEIVDNMSDADIIWTLRHFNDYKSLSEEFPERRMNQFPFEMVVTVKDLLAIVSRRAAAKNRTEQDLEPGPKWLPVTYNLTTELPQFVSYFQHREASGLDNHFICKPWDLARSLDIHITNNINYIVRLPDTGPKIVSKYVENPVLFRREEIGDVKFDIRYVVLLSSIQPLKIYTYQVFWLRFANKPFSLDHFDDYEKHFTVMNYSENTDLKQIHYDDFIPMFEKQYPDYSWRNVEKDIFQMIRELFEAATSKPPPKGIGHSPQSRAMYAIDLILKWSTNNQGERYIQPVILECNFSPDCERACQYHPFFVNDVFSVLFLDDTEGKHVTLL